jgi:hypothetical protein
MFRPKIFEGAQINTKPKLSQLQIDKSFASSAIGKSDKAEAQSNIEC